MGVSLATTGALTEGRTHYDQAISFYDPKEHRPLATRFSVDVRVADLYAIDPGLSGHSGVPMPRSETLTVRLN